MLGTSEKETILYHANVVNVSVAVLVQQSDSYLLIRETKKGLEGKWNWPSGKAHLDEDIIQAAEREAKEETGLTVKVTDFASVYYYRTRGNSNDGKMDRITVRFNFWGAVSDTESDQLDPQAEWKTRDDLRDIFQQRLFRNWITRRLTVEALENKRLPLDTVVLSDR